MRDCEFCSVNKSQYLMAFDYNESRFYVEVQDGGYIRVFDDEYPGLLESKRIKYCPMCGRNLEAET